MDPVTVVVTALTAGATAGLRDAATSSVRDAYSALREAVRTRLRARSDGDDLVSAFEADPDNHWQALSEALKAGDTQTDFTLTKLAQNLLALTGPMGTAVSKYSVSAEQSQGVIVGDNAHQTNKFS